MLSPLLKRGIGCKAECVDDVSIWFDDKDRPRDRDGVSKDGFELELMSEALEDLGSAIPGIGWTSLVDPTCSTFPCPRVRLSIGFPIGTEITPEQTAMGYTGIIGNPLKLLVSGVAGRTWFEWDTPSWCWICSSSIGIAETWNRKLITSWKVWSSNPRCL